MTKNNQEESPPLPPEQVAQMIIVLADFYVTLGMNPTRAYRAAMLDLLPEVEGVALAV